MWGLNKGDWPWLLLGFVGAIIAGGTHPSEGVFIAQVQVRYILHVCTGAKSHHRRFHEH